MYIAIEGCAHGELEIIYDSIAFLEKRENIKVDLLLCCGDFQATRNLQDLQCMAVPDKYKSICSFYKYYSGEKTAPFLTIFIGGNHEASNYLGELAYGGWVAPNIYYLGYAGVVDVKGIRIAGLSGIFKGHDFLKGHFERSPYDSNQIRSSYHVRNLEVFRLKQVSKHLDIVMSHDWPCGIHEYGDVNKLLKAKPFFSEDISKNVLGSKPANELLHHLKPSYWFSAHLHCKFAAVVEHTKEPKQSTRFLALDKCLPRRKYLQILDIRANDELPLEIKYDLEWLTILHYTNHLLSVSPTRSYMPGPTSHERWKFTPTEDELNFVHRKFGLDLKVPLNFSRTVTPYDPSLPKGKVTQPQPQINPQTMMFCERLGIDDPMAILLNAVGDTTPSSSQVLSCSLPLEENHDSSVVSSDDDQPNTTLDTSGSEDAKWFFDKSNDNKSLRISPDKIVRSMETDVKSNVSTKRLSGLSLPPPSNNTTEISGRSQIFLADYKSPISQMLSSLDSEKKEESGTLESPAAKKAFKRRNQTLYTSCDE